LPALVLVWAEGLELRNELGVRQPLKVSRAIEVGEGCCKVGNGDKAVGVERPMGTEPVADLGMEIVHDGGRSQALAQAKGEGPSEC